MISSTRVDLMQYRERALRVVDKLRKEQQGKLEIIPVAMEEAVQSGEREYPVALSKKWVEQSDWVVLIVGWHYGTVTSEDGADGLSVSEWEYRHAVNQQKKLIVFISGHPRTQTPYRALQDEVNLQDWMDQSEDQRGKSQRFREELGKQYSNFFRNIDHFEQQLESALRKALDDRVPKDVSWNLALLILKVKPAFVACMTSIRSLHHCKEVHDALHNMRQFVIKPIREGILPLWESESTLSQRIERKLREPLRVASSLLATITSSCSHLDKAGAVDLLELITKLRYSEPLLLPIPENAPDGFAADLGAYTEAVDDFARAAEAAFSCANKRMLVEQRAFDDLHSELMDNLARARGQHELSPDEESQLTDEVRKLRDNKARLVNALNTHSEWQDLNDAIETVQGFCGTKLYERRVRELVARNAERLGRLATQSMETLDADPDLDTVLHASLQSLKTELDATQPQADLDRFDRLRKAFDDSFFQVDKRVLGIVQRSLGRVEDLDKMFERLAIEQAHRQPAVGATS
jgi:hypothetical protein